MASRTDARGEIAVPVSIFAVLRETLAKEAGDLAAIHALHHAGFDAGVAAADTFRADAGGDVMGMSEEEFWKRLSAHFGRRGWGTLTHQASHEAVGTLVSTDWAEAGDGSRVEEDASCTFSSGFLAGLLSTLARGDLAVLEVGCRRRGDGSCTFAFGNAGAIHELYGMLLEGSDFDGAVAAL